MKLLLSKYKSFFLGFSLLLFFTLVFLSMKDVLGVGDSTTPVTSHKLEGTLGDNGWYTSSVKTTLLADDLESGVKETEYWVDSNSHNISTYGTSANLLANPSFETSDGGSGALGWVKVTGSGAALTRTSETAKFGSYSAKMNASSSGWSSFDTASPGIALSAGTTYTVSGWFKLNSVGGTGARIRVLLSSGGSIVAQTSSSFSGTADWQRVFLTFTPSAAADHIIEVGLDGTGTVWWDGINLYQGSSETEVSFTVSSEGTHKVNYFSTNNDGVKEATKESEEFKIDSVGPENWRNFTLTDSGNAHTFTVSITVDDKKSGIDVSSAYFQYKVNEEQGFGYHSNLTNCNSSWNGNEWKPLTTVNPNNNGEKTVTLTTPAIDYCDSTWGEGESIKFKIKDMAGNEVIKERALLAAWLSTKNGNVHSNGGINFSSTGSEANGEYIVSSTTAPIVNFTSEKDWLVSPYDTVSSLNYQYFLGKSPSSPTLPLGRLPTTSGFFINASDCDQNTRDFTVDSNVIPSGYENVQNLAAIVLICGDLTVKNSFNLHPTSSLIFAVKGKVKISKKVETMAGFYISDGEINSSYDGNDGNGLTLYGGLVSNGGFDFRTRSLKDKLNLTNPAETFVLQPQYLINKELIDLLVGNSKYIWQEVAP